MWERSSRIRSSSKTFRWIQYRPASRSCGLDVQLDDQQPTTLLPYPCDLTWTICPWETWRYGFVRNPQHPPGTRSDSSRKSKEPQWICTSPTTLSPTWSCCMFINLDQVFTSHSILVLSFYYERGNFSNHWLKTKASYCGCAEGQKV